MNNSFHVLREANRNITALLIGHLMFEVHRSSGYVLHLDWRYGHNNIFPLDSREFKVRDDYLNKEHLDE